jgi:hypothetical protein
MIITAKKKPNRRDAFEDATYKPRGLMSSMPLVVSISQKSEEQRLHSLVSNVTFSNSGLKTVSSNASPG